MQTFLPYPSFVKTAACLDYRRLGKQRVEAFQILEILLGKPSRWSNHPAVKMWRGYEFGLLSYGIVICNEWVDRDYKDNMRIKFIMLSRQIKRTDMPHWLGNDDFHKSHQSNLLRKDKKYYTKFKWRVKPDLPYIWPEGRKDLITSVKRQN